MGIQKWGDFQNNKKDKTTNEKMKTFSKKVSKKDPEESEKTQRGQVSASSEYADEVNQNIIKQNPRIDTKRKERKYNTKKVAQTIKDKKLYPEDTEDRGVANISEDVEIYGKLAKFPEGVKASKAFNWVYNLKDPKLSKKDIWYLMIEKQDTELQMIKYQQKQGVNLTTFISDLKGYYIEKYKDNKSLVEKISKIKLGGDKDGNISAITHIPNVVVEDNKKLIHKLMEDLVRLLG
tara:strand:- start:18030 stop:18734 length:705 start_codon:yes stop_codon:yes gene_type:complete